MRWIGHLLVVLLWSGLLAPCLGQTFQYSRGWTNGKRAGTAAGMAGAGQLLPSPCQLHRLRAILQGKPPASDTSYLLCELYRTPEDDARLDQLNKVHQRTPLQEEIVEK